MKNDLKILFQNKNLGDEISARVISQWKELNIRKYHSRNDAINFFINDEKGKIKILDNIEKENFSLSGKNILDVGCGKGGMLISCALRGAKVVGIDVDEEEIKIAKMRTEACGINDNVSLMVANAENMPFSDNFFDIVLAISVLEHVKNLEKVVKEMVRVTKPGGFCYISIPNSLFPREAHYKVFYIPYLSKKIGKIYLKIRGFNPNFFMENVTYPYPSIFKIKKIFKKYNMNVQNITERHILEKFTNPSLIRNKKIRDTIKYLERLKVNNLVAKLIVYLHFYPSVHLMAKKIEISF